MSRVGYKFTKRQRAEHAEAIGHRCEQCGKSATLEFHHLIPCYFASQNPVLLPHLIRDLVNCMGLCHTCHEVADKNLYSKSTREMALLAWALFDVDPEEVVKAHGRTPPVRKKKRHQEFERRKRMKFR